MLIFNFTSKVASPIGPMWNMWDGVNDPTCTTSSNLRRRHPRAVSNIADLSLPMIQNSRFFGSPSPNERTGCRLANILEAVTYCKPSLRRLLPMQGQRKTRTIPDLCFAQQYVETQAHELMASTESLSGLKLDRSGF